MSIRTPPCRLLLCLAMLTASLGAGAQPAEPVKTLPAGPVQANATLLASEIGSTRNSRVAYAMPADRGEALATTLTYLAGHIPAEVEAELAIAAPNVRIISGLTAETALEHASEAHGADARLLSAALIDAAPNLAWVHAPSAGVDWLVGMEGLAESQRIVLTNSRAAHGPAIAEHALGMLLVLTRNLRPYIEQQRDGTWAVVESRRRPITLEGRTMLVVGLGGIGAEFAEKAHGLGMRVVATRRTDAPSPAFVEHVGKPESLLAMLPQADVVAICVPLTAETEGLFGAEAFDAMKPGAYLINVARGQVVQTDALIAALESGRLAGACLDVTDPEPLPGDHPLWRTQNVLITPHVSSDAPETDARRRALFIENMRRFGAGEPLLNVVDVKAGY